MSKLVIKGTARVDIKTKVLVKRLRAGDIAVINHPELDDVAARSLLETRVKAVINAAPSVSSRYPNEGPLILVTSGIPLIDNAGSELMGLVKEGQLLEIKGGKIFCSNKLLATGEYLTKDKIIKQMNKAQTKFKDLFGDFVSNTLDYARQEIGLINGQYQLPGLKTDFKKRHALIVARGSNYKEDLYAIKSYIDEVKPVLVGVDGGADALVEAGYKPDLIVGDMDSVSDETLYKGSELVAHAYSDGHCPALLRLKRLGLSCSVFAAPGTSEDIALLMAYEKGAELIVMVGSHTNLQDFLGKGRKGMASTFLVRLKVGPVLVDAKGVSKLYRSNFRSRHLFQIILAALIPAVLIATLSPSLKQIIKLIYLRIIYSF